MDLYPKNHTIINKLLAKRQNPLTQSLHSQTSNCNPKSLNIENLLHKPYKQLIQPIISSNIPSTTQYQVQFNTEAIIIVTSKENCNTSLDQISTSENETTASNEDGSSGDDLEARKKIKVNPELLFEKGRKNSLNEADFSTTCESYSDGQSYEFSDYYSPQFGYQSHKGEESKFEEFKLDDEDEDNTWNQSFRFDTMSNFSEEDSFYMKEAQERAVKFEGKCLSGKCYDQKNPLKFKCKYNHTWEASLEELRCKWCPACDIKLKAIINFAKENGGSVKNAYYCDMITFECSKKHMWNIANKNAMRRWCSECLKEEKQEMKRRLESEKLQRQKEDEELQKRLFEESRRRVLQEAANMRSKSSGCSDSCIGSSLREYFKKIDYEIENLAKRYTTKFMNSQDFSGQCSYHQILQIYKILLMPEDILKNYMLNLSNEARKDEFRRLAKLIHPDKNKHPKAGLAFQKIYKIYEASLNIQQQDGSF